MRSPVNRRSRCPLVPPKSTDPVGGKDAAPPAETLPVHAQEAPLPSAGGPLPAKPTSPPKNPALRAHALQTALNAGQGAQLLDGAGEASAEWARASLVGPAAVRLLTKDPATTLMRLELGARKLLEKHGLPGNGVPKLLDRLVADRVLAVYE